ncbi:MAG: hypothetical protein H7210_04645, partial [Pyrinomonadaceae bacterium]|nr:hypothetical protein [Phycisphaerales bacterium]
MIAGLLFAAVSAVPLGCAVLTVDVDVYKGAITNNKEVQVEELARMAISAQPILLDLRNRLEVASREYWIYKNPFNPPDPAWSGQYMLSRTEWIPDGVEIPRTPEQQAKSPSDGKENRIFRFRSIKAFRVNEVLKRYDKIRAEQGSDSIARLKDNPESIPSVQASKVESTSKPSADVGVRSFVLNDSRVNVFSSANVTEQPGLGKLFKAYRDARGKHYKAAQGLDNDAAARVDMRVAREDLLLEIQNLADDIKMLANQNVVLGVDGPGLLPDLTRSVSHALFNADIDSDQERIFPSALGGGERSYVRVLQAIGNSMVSMLDAIRQEEAFEAREKPSGRREALAYGAAVRRDPQEVINDLVASLRQTQENIPGEAQRAEAALENARSLTREREVLHTAAITTRERAKESLEDVGRRFESARNELREQEKELASTTPKGDPKTLDPKRKDVKDLRAQVVQLQTDYDSAINAVERSFGSLQQAKDSEDTKKVIHDKAAAEKLRLGTYTKAIEVIQHEKANLATMKERIGQAGEEVEAGREAIMWQLLLNLQEKVNASAPAPEVKEPSKKADPSRDKDPAATERDVTSGAKAASNRTVERSAAHANEAAAIADAAAVASAASVAATREATINTDAPSAQAMDKGTEALKPAEQPAIPAVTPATDQTKATEPVTAPTPTTPPAKTQPAPDSAPALTPATGEKLFSDMTEHEQLIEVVRLLSNFRTPVAPVFDTRNPGTQRDVIDSYIGTLRYKLLQEIERSGKESATVENLADALNTAYEQRAAMIFIRPASAYLRTS